MLESFTLEATIDGATDGETYVATFDGQDSESQTVNLVYNCQYGTPISCNRVDNSNTELTTYTLSSIVKQSDGATATITPNSLELKLYSAVIASPLSDSQSSETITTLTDAKISFTPAVGITQDTLPDLYYGQDDSKILNSCTVDGTSTGECSIPDTLTNDNYKIYYKNQCGGFVETQKTFVVDVSTDTQAINVVSIESCGIIGSPITITTETDVTDTSFTAVFSDSENNMVTFSSCTTGDNTRTIICSQKESDNKITAGTYTLSALTGTADTFSFASVNSIEIHDTGLGVNENQSVSSDALSIEIAVTNGQMPKFYLGESDEISQCALNQDSNKVTCTLSSEQFATLTDSVYIYYENPCGKVESTGIQVTKETSGSTSTTIQVTDFAIEKDSSSVSCVTSEFTTIVLTTQDVPQGSNIQAVIENEAQTITFSTCSIQTDENGATTNVIKCSEPSLTPLMGEFSLKEITLTETDIIYNINAVSGKVKFVVPTSILGSQTETKTLDENTQTISVNVIDTNPLPKFYLNDFQISCMRDSDTIVLCSVNDDILPVSESYSLKYQGACDESLVDAQITVTKSASTSFSAAITQISLEKDNQKVCSKTEITHVYLTSDKTLSGNIAITLTDSKLNNYPSTSCSIDDKIIDCIFSGLIAESYTVSTITSSHTSITLSFDDVSAQTLSYEPETSELGIQTNNAIEITADSPNFNIVLADNTKIPKFYIKEQNAEGDATTEITCNKVDGSQTNVQCETDDSNIPADGKTYVIYYKPACGSLTDSQITVTKSVTIPSVEIASVSTIDDKTCTTAAFTGIKITTKEAISGTAFTATVQDSKGTEYTFASCNKDDDTTITCGQLDEASPKVTNQETYRLTQLSETSNAETYQITDDTANEIKFTNYALGTTDPSSQEINSSKKTFTIMLADASNDIPPFFVGNDANKPIKCKKSDAEPTELICSASDSVLPPDSVAYTIYYRQPCQESLESTSIEVTKTSTTEETTKTTVSVTDISFASTSSKACSVSEITTIYFVIDNVEVQGTITGGLQDAENTDTKYPFKECTANSATQISCTFDSSLSIGKYTLSSFNLDTASYNVELGSDCAKTLEIKGTMFSGVDEDNKEQTITSSNNEFSIPFNSEPTLYFDKDGSISVSSYFTCSLEGITYKCTEKEQGLNEGDSYTVYYLDECNEIQSTGVQVTKEATVVPPGNPSITALNVKNGLVEQTSICVSGAIEITLTVSSVPDSPSIFSLVLNGGSEDNKPTFTSCTATGTTIVCNGDISTEGAYTIDSFTVDATLYEISQEVSQITINYKTAISGMGEQSDSIQSVTTTDDKFIIVLDSKTAPIPKIYVENSSQEITEDCSRAQDNQFNLECSNTKGYLQQGESDSLYTIYYQPACGALSSLFQVNVPGSGVTKTSVNVISMSISEYSSSLVCQVEKFSKVFLSTDGKVEGTIEFIIQDALGNQYTSTSCTSIINSGVALGDYIECSFSELPISTELSFFSVTTNDSSYELIIGDNVKETKIKYEVNYLGQQTTNLVTIDFTIITDFTIVLASEDTVKPEVQAKKEFGDPITIPCVKTGSNLLCTPAQSNIPNGDYTVYIINACKAEQSTSITLKINYQGSTSKTYTISSVTLTETKTCAYEEFSAISVTTSEIPTNKFTVKLNDGTNDHSFTCEVENASNPLTCTSSTPVSAVGTYSFTSVEWVESSVSDTFDTTTLPTVSIEIKTALLGTQTPTQPITSDDAEFTVVLTSESLSVKIYIGKDGAELVCDSIGTTLTCPAKNLSEGAHTVYYEDSCGNKVKAGITLQRGTTTTKTDITVNSINIKNAEDCTFEALSAVEITVNDTVSSITNCAIVLTSSGVDYTFGTCTPTGTTISCEGATPTPVVGSYTVKSISSNEYEFDISSVSTTVLKLEAKTLGTQTSSQEIKGEVLKFKVVILDKDVVPEIFIQENERQKVTCEADSNDETGLTLLCDPATFLAVEGQAYDVYYRNPCGKLSAAGISVKKPKEEGPAEPITVKSVKLNDGKTCVDGSVSSIAVTLSAAPTGSLTYVTLSKDGSDYVISGCTAEDVNTQYTCTTFSNSLIVGTYTVKEITGDLDTFTFSDLPELTIGVVILGTQENGQIVRVDTETFYIILASESTTQPEIYIESTKLTKCKKDGTKVTCEQEGLMENDGTYTIKIKNGCGDFQDVITVDKQAPVVNTIEISKVVIPEGETETCSTEGITSIEISVSTQPTYDLTSAEIKKDGTTITFSKCTYSGNTITCETPSETIGQGEYTLTNVISSNDSLETFTFANDATVTFSYYKKKIVEQTVKSYTISQEEPSFEIEIAQDSNATPKIFATKGSESIDITASCKTLTDTNTQIKSLDCTPVGLTEGETYTVTYIDACESEGSTEIEITIAVPPSPIDVLSLIISGEGDATSTKGITGFEMEIDHAPQSTTIDAILENRDDATTYKFTCAYEAVEIEISEEEKETKHYVKCSTPDKEVPVGSYTLKSVTGNKEPFELEKVQNVVLQYKEEKKPIKEPSDTEKEQTVSKNTPLTFTLASEEEEIPKIYLVNPENKEEKFSIEGCTKEGTTVSCPAYTETTPKGKFNVCFEGIFEDMVETGITVHVPVSVTSYTFGNDLGCAEGSFTDIKITFDSDVSTFGITEVKISALLPESEKPVEGSMPCVSNDAFNLQCYFENTENDIPSKEENTIVATYTLVGFTVTTEVNKIDVSSVEPIELKEAFNYLGEQIETNPIITNTTLTFTIVLASAETEPPHIFVGPHNDNEIKCDKDTDSTQLICEPSDTNMPTNQLYEIYYENTCGELINTGIIVDYQNEQKTPEIEIQTGSTYIGMYKLLIAGLFVLIL